MKITSVTTILCAILLSLRTFVMATPHDQIRELIIDGRNATPGEFPFFAAGLGCGGTLIHEDVVLTAAHCNADGIFNFNDFVQIGGTINPGLPFLDGEIIPTVCAVNHPKYKTASKGYDIALVKLARPSTAPLIELNFNKDVPSVNEIVTTLGYGISGYEEAIPGQESPSFNPILLQVLSPLYIQSEQTCRSNSPSYDVDFHLCTNDDDPATTTCQGDSGGPIITENGVQVGILSYGANDPITNECFGNTPDYWTNVAMFEAFIKEGICALSYNPPAYCPKDIDLSLLLTCLDPPTSAPTNAPTNAPTKAPTHSPNKSRKMMTHAPTHAPTNAPTKPPTRSPTGAPQASMKSKGMMSKGGMSAKSKSHKMTSKKKSKKRYLK